MRTRQEGVSMLCPGCGNQLVDHAIDRSLLVFRARREPACRMNVEPGRVDEVVFEPSEGIASDDVDSIWAGWLVD